MNKRKIKVLIFSYGIVPMLLFIERLEEREQYENAKYIQDCINEHCRKYGIEDAPKKYGIKAKRWMLDSLKDAGFDNYIAVNNIEEYADSIEAELTNIIVLKEG